MFVRAEVRRPAAPHTSCKRVKLVEVDEEVEGSKTIRWALTDNAINNNARCMVGLEGHVGRRGEWEGPAMLWEGVPALETRLDGVEDWVGTTLTQ